MERRFGVLRRFGIPGAVPPRRALISNGGDTVSTGARDRWMHAERHRLVNPVENNITADTQLALAA